MACGRWKRDTERHRHRVHETSQGYSFGPSSPAGRYMDMDMDVDMYGRQFAGGGGGGRGAWACAWMSCVVRVPSFAVVVLSPKC